AAVEDEDRPTRVVRPPAPPAAPPSAPDAARPASGFANSGLPSSLPVPTGWDETDLEGLEKELMLHVGPIARVLVRRAARGQVDLGEVRRLVAASIVDGAVR